MIDFSHYLSNARSAGCLDGQRGVSARRIITKYYLFQAGNIIWRCPGQLHLLLLLRLFNNLSFFFFCSSPFSRLSFIIGYNSLRSVQLDSISKVKFTANSVQFKPWLWHESRQNKSLSVKIYEIIFIQFNQSIKSVNIDRCQLHSWMVYDRTQIMIKYDEAKPDGKKSNQIWSITLV